MFIPTAVVEAASEDDFWDATIIKSADESLAANTTLQDDDELFFAVTASTPYHFQMILAFTASGAGDFKHAFALSTGAFATSAGWRRRTGLGPTTAVAQIDVAADMTTAMVQAGIATPIAQVEVLGAFVPDTNANLKLQWAQNASDGTPTIVKAGSLIRYRAMI